MAAVSKRKRHVQQSLFRRGGKRRGAGRKPRGARSGERHKSRPDFKSYQPLHVVMRVGPAVGSLRRRDMYKAIRAASIAAARSERLRVVHISLQREHVHMLVEAEHKAALARGMQSFTISAARNINQALGAGEQPRRGRVFTDRYHLTVITSPTQARNSLSYVLNNWRHHAEDRSELSATWLVDPFSTGILFPDWTERQDEPWMWPFRETYDPLVVYRPQSWLLRDGWKTAGPISYRDSGDTPRGSRADARVKRRSAQSARPSATVRAAFEQHPSSGFVGPRSAGGEPAEPQGGHGGAIRRALSRRRASRAAGRQGRQLSALTRQRASGAARGRRW